jgi:hypothetical protein
MKLLFAMNGRLLRASAPEVSCMALMRVADSGSKRIVELTTAGWRVFFFFWREEQIHIKNRKLQENR